MYIKLLPFLIILFAIICNFNTFYSDCIFIHYGGYSGFWYYYIYLQKNYILDKKIYCYSSGCLSVVASIQHNNNQSLFSFVSNLKQEYINNKIDKYEIKNNFINEISNKVIDIKNYDINILTSNFYGKCIVKKPNNISELILALDETSNVPILTTKISLQKNLDGYFCFNFQNKCSKNIRLPLSFYLYFNILNPNINYNDIYNYLNF
jgi:hypothetical protein